MALLFNINRKGNCVLNKDVVKLCPELAYLTDEEVLFWGKKKSGVYCILNKINGKKYIGSSVNIYNRKNHHFHNLRMNKHHSVLLQRSWNKYREGNFEFKIIELTNSIKEEIVAREQFYIDNYNPEFNILKLAYSSLGRKHSEETKLKLSKWRTGRVTSEQTKEKLRKNASRHWLGKKRIITKDWAKNISIANKGRKQSEEHVKKRMEWKKNWIPTDEHRENCRKRMTGIRRTDAEKEKLRIAFTGRFVSEETRRKKSIAGTGRKHSEATKIKIGLASKGRKHSNETKALLKSILAKRREAKNGNAI